VIWSRFLAGLFLLVGIVLSPLWAAAATIPMLIAHEAAVRPTSTTALGRQEAVRPETAYARSTAYDDADFGYGKPRGLTRGARVIHAYDDAVKFAEPRALVDGVIYDALAASPAAEGSTALVEGGEVWNARGGIDFSKSTAFEGQVQIPYTGSRMLDYQAANQAAGLGDSMRAPAGFVWHHLDDYNALTNTGTMQLVDQAAHMANAPHIGGVAQWVEWMGVPYAP
jgi:hypothetical protein